MDKLVEMFGIARKAVYRLRTTVLPRDTVAKISLRAFSRATIPSNESRWQLLGKRLAGSVCIVWHQIRDTVVNILTLITAK